MTYQQLHEQRLLQRYGQQRCARAEHLGSNQIKRSWCSGNEKQSLKHVSYRRSPDGYIDCKTHAADQVGHRRASRWVASLQETRDACGVSDTLDCKLASTSDSARNLVKEQRTNSRSITDVALLAGSTSVDQADRAACSTIGQLVVGAAAILALGNSVLLRCQFADQKLVDRERFCVRDRGWRSEST